jgi:hypothetical protein
MRGALYRYGTLGQVEKGLVSVYDVRTSLLLQSHQA